MSSADNPVATLAVSEHTPDILNRVKLSIAHNCDVIKTRVRVDYALALMLTAFKTNCLVSREFPMQFDWIINSVLKKSEYIVIIKYWRSSFCRATDGAHTEIY